MNIIQENGKINFHIANFAARRGVVLTLENPDEKEGQDQIWIWDAENDCEPVLFYNIDNKGELFYRSNLMSSLEDLPLWIGDKNKLKNLICYVSDMLKAEKM